MSDSFEWARIGLACGLMAFAFIALPAFFFWKDKREDARAAAEEMEMANAEDARR